MLSRYGLSVGKQVNIKRSDGTEDEAREERQKDNKGRALFPSLSLLFSAQRCC